jgi:predicted transcriptional regulator
MSTKARRNRSTPSTQKPRDDTNPNARTDTEAKVWKALHDNPNTTAVELARAAQVGRSTAQKILTKWAGEGSATRTAGTIEGGRRSPDHWTIANHDKATAAPQASPATSPPHTPPTPQDCDSTDAASTSETQTTPTHPDEGVTTITTESDGAATKRTRLSPGALHGMVEDYLRDHPNEQFSPTAIAKALGGRSSGAVNNALERMTKAGIAVKAQNRPKRFTLAPTEHPTPSAPSS